LSVTIIFTTPTTPIAYLTWRFIETPCIRLGKQLGRAHEAQQAASHLNVGIPRDSRQAALVPRNRDR
jgi:peptidoglycan/LPS O-acetylase OafA/YrhL